MARRLRTDSSDGDHRDLEWRLNSLLHLFRLAHHEVGDGHWIADKDVPTIPRDVSLGIAGGDRTEPKFVLPSTPSSPPGQAATFSRPSVSGRPLPIISTSQNSLPLSHVQPAPSTATGLPSLVGRSSTSDSASQQLTSAARSGTQSASSSTSSPDTAQESITNNGPPTVPDSAQDPDQSGFELSVLGPARPAEPLSSTLTQNTRSTSVAPDSNTPN